LSLLDPRLWLALALSLALSYGGGRWQQHRLDILNQQSALVKAMQEARTKEDAANEAVRLNRRARDAEMQRINDQLVSALGELRKRPSRLSAPTGATCEGGTGASLYAEDATAALGEAARADRLRAALAECYSYIDSLPKPAH
jgi:hypothetical protein